MLMGNLYTVKQNLLVNDWTTYYTRKVFTMALSADTSEDDVSTKIFVMIVAIFWLGVKQHFKRIVGCCILTFEITQHKSKNSE